MTAPSPAEAARVDLLRRIESHSLVAADDPAVDQLVEGLAAVKVKRRGRRVVFITDAGAALLNRWE